MSQSPPPPTDPPPVGPPVVAPQQNGLGIAALVLGVAGFFIAWIPGIGILGLLLAMVGVVLGVVALSNAGTNPAVDKNIAIAGTITSAVAVVVPLVILLVGLAYVDSRMDEMQRFEGDLLVCDPFEPMTPEEFDECLED